MNNLLLGCLLLFSPTLLFAHNPLSAKYYLEHSNTGTFVNIYLSQDGVNQAMVQQHGDQILQEYDTPAFKQLIVDYIRSNFKLTVDGQEVALLEGGIKLGSHQTDLKFLLSPFSKNVKQLEISIPAFQENGQHQTIFTYNIYDYVDKVILKEANNYQSVILVGEAKPSSNSWLLAAIGGILFLLTGVFLRKRAKQPTVA